MSHLPDNTGRFQLFSDTSKAAAGLILYQIKNGTTDLELLILHVNISQFKQWLIKIDCDCTGGNLTMIYIKKIQLNQPIQQLKDY